MRLARCAAWLGQELSGGAQLVLLFLGFLAPLTSAIAWEWYARRRNPAAAARERFSLRLDPSGLIATGEHRTMRTFALESVDGFEGGPRLGVRLRDGTRARLRCVLPLVRDHASLAARLDEALRQLRAANADYRGTPRVRVATSAPELEADESVDIEDEGRVEDAKQEVTRKRRIRRTQEELEEGQRRPCCWPGCKHRERTGR
jgi:hypothetical protein